MLMNLLGDITNPDEPNYTMGGWTEQQHLEVYKAIWRSHADNLDLAIKMSDNKKICLHVSDREVIQAAAEVLDSCTVEQGIVLGILIKKENDTFLAILNQMNMINAMTPQEDPLEVYRKLHTNVISRFAQGLDPLPMILGDEGIDPSLN